MKCHSFTHSIAAILLATIVSTAAAEEDLMGSLKDGTIGRDFFVGDWCLVGSERDGDPAEPNLLYKFVANGAINYEKSDTGDKLHHGSWRLTSTMMMLKIAEGMYMVRVDSISQDEFSVGGKLGYTFQRGVCEK
jgi:hypothetical protein